jgi:hypothetical protein
MAQVQRQKDWYEKNKDALNAARKTYYAQNKDAFRNRRLLNLYGITLEQYNDLLAKQGGVCAICQGPHRGRGKFYHVDHDHKTGDVRGLLCHYCNTAIGSLKDDPALLEKAAAYLRRGV